MLVSHKDKFRSITIQPTPKVSTKMFLSSQEPQTGTNTQLDNSPDKFGQEMQPLLISQQSILLVSGWIN
jgi:hypothetical protein